MSGRRSVLWWLALLGAGLCVAAAAAPKQAPKAAKKAEKTGSAAVGQPGEVIKRLVEVGEVVDSDFERFGFWDESCKYEHEYAGETAGYLTYAFSGVDRPVVRLSVTARLSAEHGESAGKPEETSDVTVSVNGVELGTQTIMPDNGLGQPYTYQVSDPKLLAKMALKPTAGNLLRFEIRKTAKNQHGLCVYGRTAAYDDPEPGSPIVIDLEVRGEAKKK